MTLALALLVVGGIALFGALTSKQSAPGSPTPASSQTTTGSAGGNAAPSTATEEVPTLQIEVIGAPTRVYVAIPGGTSATVLQNGVLNTGEIRKYSEDKLVAVVYDAAAVEVSINGKVQPKGGAGKRQTWSAERQS